MKLILIAAMMFLQTILADPVMIPASEAAKELPPLSACSTMHPKEQSMKCMCVVQMEKRYDPLVEMMTRSGENVIDVLLASCRLSDEAEMALEEVCHHITTNPLLDDLLLLHQGQMPKIMKYTTDIGVNLGWVDSCLDAVFADI